MDLQGDSKAAPTAPMAVHSDGGGSAANCAGEDRLSALPNDLLVLILQRLRTMEAARTSVLSRRWRRVWTFIPELSLEFSSMPDGDIAAAIAAHSVDMRGLVVLIRDAAPGPGSTAALLSAAARHLSGFLGFYNLTRANATPQGAAAAAAVELPCFDRATILYLDLGRLRVSIAPAGVFARLVEIFLRRVRFDDDGDPCELGAAVSSPRCPCLVRLTVRDADGVGDLAIHSESLLELELKWVRGLRRLGVAAPALEDLKVVCCFFADQNQPVADISACHQLLSLEWKDLFDASTVQLGRMEHLQWLATCTYQVYGNDGFLKPNRSCPELLQCFKFRVIPSICLTLVTLPDIGRFRYLMEHMTVILGVRFLHMVVAANGHAFGASSFHVLRNCTGIRRLLLELHTPTKPQAETKCSSGCICDQPPNWKTEELLLNHLEEVQILELNGSEHEISFVKRLFNWAKVLKRMTIRFGNCVTESMVKEYCQLLQSCSRSEICFTFYMYRDSTEVLYSPED